MIVLAPPSSMICWLVCRFVFLLGRDHSLAPSLKKEEKPGIISSSHDVICTKTPDTDTDNDN
jgi:hypothetical protein